MLSVEQTGEKYGLSRASVARYVRISKLIKPLQDRVDAEQIGMYPAVSISYLTVDEQNELESVLSQTSFKVDMKKAAILREYSDKKSLSRENIILILSGKMNPKKAAKKSAPAPAAPTVQLESSDEDFSFLKPVIFDDDTQSFTVSMKIKQAIDRLSDAADIFSHRGDENSKACAEQLRRIIDSIQSVKESCGIHHDEVG